MVNHVRVAASTAASGTFDIVAGGAELPVAAQFIVTQATTDDTITANAVIGWGATDGTNQQCLTVACEDNQQKVDSARIQDFTKSIALHNAATAFQFSFSFNSWLAGGVRLNIDSQAPSGYLIKAVFYYAEDVDEAAVVNIGLGSTTSPIVYTGLTFQPDVLFTHHLYSSSTANNVHSPLGLGVVYDNGSSVLQKSMSMCGDDGTTTGGDQNTYISNDKGLCATLLDSFRWSLTFSAMSATGFTHTSSASTSAIMHVLALKLAAGVEFDLFDTTLPTTGNYSKSLSFDPVFGGLYSIVGPTAYNTYQNALPSVSFAASTFDGTTTYTESFTDLDGADPTICKSLSSDQFRILDSDGVTDSALSSNITLGTGSIDATLSTNPTADVLGFGWAISGDTASTTDITATGGMSFGSSAGLNAAGTLAGISSLSFGSSPDLNATGTLTGVSDLSFGSSPDLNAAGTLAGVSDLSFGSSLDLNATGVLSGAANLSFGESLTLKGVGSLGASDSVSFGGSGAINATGSLASIGNMVFGSSADLSQASVNALNTTASITFGGSGAINATGSLASIGNMVFGSSADLSQASVNALNTTASITFGANAALSATGTLSASTNLRFGDTLSLNATGVLSASSSLTFGNSFTLSGVGALQAEAPISFGSSADLTTAIADAMIASVAMSFGSSATLNATGTLTATGGLTLSTTAVLSQPGAAIPVEGLEYTMGGTRLHFTISGDPLHYTIN